MTQQNTTTAPKTNVPPPDEGGETELALGTLKRWRRQLAKFSPGWQDWILNSLVKGRAVQKPLIPDEQADAPDTAKK